MTTEARRVLNHLMTEQQLLECVVELCERLGLLVSHINDGLYRQAIKSGRPDTMTGAKGFPDLVIVGRRRLLFVELKRQRGKLSDEQKAWRAAIEETAQRGRHDYYLWRPHDWHSGEIEDVLRGIA